MTNDELLRQLAAARRQLTRWIVLTQPLSNKLEELRALRRLRTDRLRDTRADELRVTPTRSRRR